MMRVLESLSRDHIQMLKAEAQAEVHLESERIRHQAQPKQAQSRPDGLIRAPGVGSGSRRPLEITSDDG
jgi:hypothetical protein